MTDDELLRALADDERRLRFSSFTNDDAIALGLALLDAARQEQAPVAIDVRRNGQQLFHAALDGTSADNDEWIRRKCNVVDRFGHSSFYVGTLCRVQGGTIEEVFGVDPREYADHGGAFPVIVHGVGVVGTVAVSGLPQADDHRLVVEVLERLLT
ncbi:MAG: heme-degrading domain-containing protein [Ilumatobacteraceae bacterium]|jgi:uncharacterized protein (UPF0303 family)|nr:heme-degrading domain-containing protein [Ilumatobacteraceae bacterium]